MVASALDDGDTLNPTTANNAPGLVSNPFDIRADWGPATYNATNVAVISAVYELPFGRGKTFAADVNGWSDRLVSGWSIDSIITAQSGFPITPQLSYNPTQSGDTKNPVRPFINPDLAAQSSKEIHLSGLIQTHFLPNPITADSTAIYGGIRFQGRGWPLGISPFARTPASPRG